MADRAENLTAHLPGAFPGDAVERSIPDLFEEAAARFPDRPAVRAGSGTLTYDELNRAADRVAWAVLDRCGAGDQPVAVLMPKGPMMRAAMMGVLKAGRPCVPIDVSIPPSRCAFILGDTGAPLVVADAAHAGGAGDCPVLNVDEPAGTSPDSAPDRCVPPDALAYVFYTSGSTGEPKGVMQTHRNMLRAVMRYVTDLRITPQDVIACPSSPAFLGSGRASLGALLTGAAYLPIALEELGGLADTLNREGATIFSSPSSSFRQLLWAMKEPGQLPRLTRCYNGGEPLFRADVERWRQCFPDGAACLHAMASTEADVYRQFPIDADTKIGSETVPLGYEVEDAEVFLLDDDGCPVPPGEVGEIVVRSPYLSPGYWGKPDLTAAVFRPGPGGGERCCYTGDLGRMRPDGCLEGMGRKDSQVKIRGYLVVMDGVERALRGIRGVREAAVTARPGPSGEDRLVGHVVVDAAARLTVTGLRRTLASTLPAHMVPSAFVYLDALPLDRNGKVDRRRLPDPGRPRPRLDVAFEPPQGPIEREVAGM